MVDAIPPSRTRVVLVRVVPWADGVGLWNQVSWLTGIMPLDPEFFSGIKNRTENSPVDST